ncbi:MAG TPA: adenylate/guanylate cyclase domain-containing protein [candidate division Zixibacteria bacterium]|nr:adenylate/guanylate cyclase domain-containing protein [candidate division Zixibacteria bacterium]
MVSEAGMQAEPGAEPSLAEQGRAALARHAWTEALEKLTRADAQETLSPADVDAYADAAWWNGRLEQAIDLRERAYAAAIRAGLPVEAAKVAIKLARDNIYRSSDTMAGAWLQRAERLLSGMDESALHGWLAATAAFRAGVTGDVDRALAESVKAEDIAAHTGDRDLAAMAQAEHGFALIASGKVAEGLALLDEASVAAVGGELEPETAGGICCTAIGACTTLGEWTRAAEWTDAQDRWCRREGIAGYPGMCRLYRSEIKERRGKWLEAEAEAQQASVELAGFVPAAAGLALYRIGEIRLRRGDLVEAEEALVQAHALGAHVEPALSLLRLAQGRVEAAAEGIREAIERPPRTPNWHSPPGSPLYMLPLLRAQVEIALAAGDETTARSALEQLESIAERFGGAAISASAIDSRGLVQLRTGQTDDAVSTLRDAVDAWTALDAPYDTARARLLLAEALAARGQVERAGLELQAARSTFEQLGAGYDLRRTDEIAASLGIGAAHATMPTGSREVRAFAFTDIVDSTRLGEVLGDSAWRAVLARHDEAVRSVVAEHGGEVVKHTGDGFFLAFADAGRAIDAMVALQRRLEAHRAREGFAPTVRVGIHAAEASRSGTDYIGRGVTLAARIGAAAAGSEILVSRATLDASRRSFPIASERILELKGFSTPTDAVSIRW